MINDRCKVVLGISLSLKALKIFPDREYWLKNGPKATFSRKSKKLGSYAKTIILLFSIYFDNKNTLCVQISSKNNGF